MTIRTIRHPAAAGTGPFYAFFRTDSTFADYVDDRVELTQVGSTGMYTGSWDDTNGLVAFVFQGSATPTDWSQAVAVVDFTTDAIVAGEMSTADGYNLVQSLRIMLAILAGRVAGAEGFEEKFRAIDNSKVRVTSTVDQYGNRSFLSIDKD